MAGIFSKIISGEIPSHKIAENENFFAFLDINPITKGHTLVIPKHEIDYIFDLDDNLLSEMTVYAKKIAIAIQKTIPCQRIALMVLGLEVPHAHIHLIPIKKESDLLLSNPRLQMNSDEFDEVAQQIRQQL